MLCVPSLQPEEKRNNFQITTNFQVILGIFQEIEKNLPCIIGFFSEDAVLGLILPLCNNTALGLVLLESINNFQRTG